MKFSVPNLNLLNERKKFIISLTMHRFMITNRLWCSCRATREDDIGNMIECAMETDVKRFNIISNFDIDNYWLILSQC